MRTYTFPVGVGQGGAFVLAPNLFDAMGAVTSTLPDDWVGLVYSPYTQTHATAPDGSQYKFGVGIGYNPTTPMTLPGVLLLVDPASLVWSQDPFVQMEWVSHEVESGYRIVLDDVTARGSLIAVIPASADLSVTISVVEPLRPLLAFTYTATVFNNGPDPALYPSITISGESQNLEGSLELGMSWVVTGSKVYTYAMSLAISATSLTVDPDLSNNAVVLKPEEATVDVFYVWGPPGYHPYTLSQTIVLTQTGRVTVSFLGAWSTTSNQEGTSLCGPQGICYFEVQPHIWFTPDLSYPYTVDCPRSVVLVHDVRLNGCTVVVDVPALPPSGNYPFTGTLELWPAHFRDPNPGNNERPLELVVKVLWKLFLAAVRKGAPPPPPPDVCVVAPYIHFGCDIDTNVSTLYVEPGCNDYIGARDYQPGEGFFGGDATWRGISQHRGVFSPSEVTHTVKFVEKRQCVEVFSANALGEYDGGFLFQSLCGDEPLGPPPPSQSIAPQARQHNR